MGQSSGAEGSPRPQIRVADRVAEQLRTKIIAGEFPVGSKLPAEKELSRRFEVGRSSMREAVRTLQAAGYLRSAHGSGVFVLTDSPRGLGPVDLSLNSGFTVSDLFEARVAIEAQTASLAADRLTDHHRQMLQSILHGASGEGVDDEAFVQFDRRFHRQVADASGNPLLLHMWDALAHSFEDYSRRVIGMEGRRGRAHRDHLGIAEAIIAGDPTRAGRLATEHVLTVQRELEGTAVPDEGHSGSPVPGGSEDDVHDQDADQGDH